ncbi:mediator of RNA polymerase II transcription subunit 30-like isoform X2 [Varroa destructor]|uniref:Mediator of RNA polymerase II transcription subunit 30 n=1 Tax=Varroa destructor TaxID=109461 RepID=A0A7M7K4R3_VARDE|nr:mediator of RNA polymerase II transcription subunit 30-like isoform X2 [Varroa destructor]
MFRQYFINRLESLSYSMASPYHQGGGSHGPTMGGGGSGGGPMGPGGGGIGGYTPVPQMHPGAMSLEGHNGISNEQPDQDGNPQDSQQQQQQEFNIPVMCRIGQETVQEIVSRAGELFQLLRTLGPPTGSMNPQASTVQEERKVKLNEILKIIQQLFKRLRRVYEICDMNCAGGEFSTLEPDVATIQLVPLEDERRKDEEEKKPLDSARQFIEERQMYQEQVYMKNRQIKEIIDMLRSVVCEVNTMLGMRKKHLPFSNRMSSYGKPKPNMF